jgi:hypothetical protein
MTNFHHLPKYQQMPNSNNAALAQARDHVNGSRRLK